MERLADFVLHHRKWVMVFWALMFVVGIAASGAATERLTTDFSLPGQPGYETSKEIIEQYGNGGSTQPFIPIATVPEGETALDNMDEITAVFEEIDAENPTFRSAYYDNSGDDVFLTDDGRTTYALVFVPFPESFDAPLPSEAIAPILEAAAEETGIEWTLTSYDMLALGESSETEAPSVLFETLLGALGALAVLLFLFASFLALVPLLIAAVSILTTFTVVFLLTYVTDMSFIVQFLISLVGLGVAIDYSLLLVTRWREERDHGRENHEAVKIAMSTAGRAVVSSAGTVAISLIALLVIPVPFLRSMGLGGMLIPVVSTIVVLTLLPALLGGIGPRVDWPKIRHENKASRAWAGWAAMIVRRRWIAAGVALALLALLIMPVFGIKIGQAQTSSLASSGPAFEALQLLQDGGVPDGVVSPLEMLVEGDSSEARASSTDEVVANTNDVDGIEAAFAPTTPTWSTDVSQLSIGIPTEEAVDSTNASVVTRVNDANAAVPGFAGTAGAAAIVLDYIDAVYGNFPLVIGIIALVTFLLLARAFRSLLLPAEGCATEHRIRCCHVRCSCLVLAGRQRIRGDLRHIGHRLDHLLAAGTDLCFPLRPLDGLRGVHPVSNARGVRRHRQHRCRGHARPRENRALGDRRCTHPLLRIPSTGVLPGDGHQGVRDCVGLRHSAGRHTCPRLARPGPGLTLRSLELVASRMGSQAASRRAACGGSRSGVSRRGSRSVCPPLSHPCTRLPVPSSD